MGWFEGPAVLVRLVAAMVSAVFWTLKRYPGVTLLALVVWLLASGGRGW